MSNCPSGYIKRNSYNRKSYERQDGVNVSGTHVKSGCIKATSQSGKKESEIQKKLLAQKSKLHSRADKKFGSIKCPKGQIERSGTKVSSYSKKSGSKIEGYWRAPSCVSTGNLHKKKQLFVVRKGALEKFGYDNVKKLSAVQRHKALNEALKKIDPLSVYRKVNALYVFNKDKHPTEAALFEADKNYIKSTKAYQSRSTSKKSSKKSSRKSSRKSSKK